MKNTLTFTQNFIYGLPGLPLAMLGVPLFVYLPSYYSQNLGLSLTAVGFALLLARMLDVITDPLIGLLNDRYPRSLSLLARRKCFILLGLPLLLVSIHFLLRPPADVGVFYLFIWSLITYFAWTLINIPWLALGAEISTDYHEKSALASSREIFAVIGTVIVMCVPFIFGTELKLDVTLDHIALILLCLLPLSLIPLLWKINIVPTPMQTQPQLKQNQTQSTGADQSTLFNLEALKGLISQAPIIKLLPAYFMNSFANALPATLFILFVTHVIQTPEKVGLLLISYFLSAIIGIPLWLALAKKTDKHRCWCIALIGSILSFVWVPFLQAGDAYVFLIICIASGIFLGADVVMPASIQADIAQTQNSTALLFGLWGLLTKLALALSIGIAFPLLDFMGLNASTSQNQPIDTSNSQTMTLIIMYAVLPILIKIWVLFKMWHFPFNKHYFLSKSTSSDTIEGQHDKLKTQNIHSRQPMSSSGRV